MNKTIKTSEVGITKYKYLNNHCAVCLIMVINSIHVTFKSALNSYIKSNKTEMINSVANNDYKLTSVASFPLSR